MNEDHVCEIERALGFIYPASFRSRIEQFTALCGSANFKRHFTAATLLLSAAEIVAERERMGVRESLGVAGVPLPATDVDKSDCSSNMLVPFLRDEGRQSPDTYAFDLGSRGPEYSVVVWSYADPMVVHARSGFTAFYRWLCGRIPSNEPGNA